MSIKIGCKLPNGFIMELIEAGPLNMPKPMGARVLIKGSNSLLIHSQNPNPLVKAFAFTDVEDEAFARKWFEVNKDLAFVKAGLVFISESAKPVELKAAAKDRVKELTGLEPLNPDKDARIPKGAQPDAEQLKRLGVAA